MSLFRSMKTEKVQRDPKTRKVVKTREFEVTLLGWLSSDGLWDAGKTDDLTKPIYIAYLGTEQTCKAFTANFRAGRKATGDDQAFKIPKKSPHRWTHRREGDINLTTAYIPELFHLEPTTTPERMSFVFMPPAWWVTAQAELLQDDFGKDATEAARAALFAAYLDRRSTLPLVRDLRFHLQLFRAIQDQKLATGPSARVSPWFREPSDLFASRSLVACGLDPPLCVDLSHDDFDAFLTEQTTTYFEEEIQNGTHRIPTNRRLLPIPPITGPQLCLDFVAP